MKEIAWKPGSHLLDCCIEACREAGRSVETVKMTFYKVSIEVEPGMSVRGIRDRWWAARNQKEIDDRCADVEQFEQLRLLKVVCIQALDSANREITCARAIYRSEPQFIAASAGWQVRAATIEELLKLAGIEPEKEVEVADRQ